jgi:fumarate reductase flavoprotein subunit
LSAEVKYDVIVIGAGVAGLTAARRSQQLGANVVLIEKGTENDANNTRRSFGAFYAAYFDPKSHRPDELYEAIIELTDGHARPNVARAWADNVRRSLEFLTAEGGVFEKINAPEAFWNVNGPPPRVVEELGEREPKWKGAANDRLLNRLTESFVRGGGTYRPGTRVVELETDKGTVVGVHVEPPAGSRRELVRGQAVIMADGGFQGNPELIAKYVTRHTYSLQCSDLDTGDCLQMAMAIGAKAVELDAAVGQLVLRDKVTHPNLAHPPAPTMLMNAAMVVNGNGERFGDEALQTPPAIASSGYFSTYFADLRLASLMRKSDVPGDSWVIFDDAIWETAGRKLSRENDPSLPQSLWAMQTPNPTIVEHGGTLLSASSIVDLAVQSGLPADRLQKTVDAFNRFSRDGTPLAPPRSVRADPIAAAPFHAIPLVPEISCTIGGVLVNEHGQALDQQERPIPGLYAAGGTMGGLTGGPRDGWAGGWSEATTFGLLSAQHAVSQIRASGAPGRG